MKLLTKQLENRFAKVGSQEEKGLGAKAIAKFFTPDSNWTWYASEYHPEDRVFFGLVDGQYAELGYFSLDELESVRGPMGLPIERDINFQEKTLRDIEDKIIASKHGGW
jgi:hypothetical protein